MPNHVTHIAKFDGKNEDVSFILNIIKTEENDGEKQWIRHIDFNNIIPQPKSLFFGALSSEDEKRMRGWDWYNWNRQNWGTKWNAYSTEKNDNTIMFDTAWSSPIPVMEKLHEMCRRFNVSCKISYADEDAGCNTGFYNLGGYEFVHIMFDDNTPDAWQAYRDTHKDWADYYERNADGTMRCKEE